MNPGAQNGVSVPTQRGMASNPDLDQGLFRPQPLMDAGTPTPMGGDPTRQVTQQQYDQMLMQQKAQQADAYQRYLQRGKR